RSSNTGVSFKQQEPIIISIEDNQQDIKDSLTEIQSQGDKLTAQKTDDSFIMLRRSDLEVTTKDGKIENVYEDGKVIVNQFSHMLFDPGASTNLTNNPQLRFFHENKAYFTNGKHKEPRLILQVKSENGVWVSTNMFMQGIYGQDGNFAIGDKKFDKDP